MEPASPTLPEKGPDGLPPPERVGYLEKLKRLRQELAYWKSLGFPLASPAVRRERLAICQRCRYYRAEGNFGLGECTAPGCGCSRLKTWLASSRCPVKKWGMEWKL